MVQGALHVLVVLYVFSNVAADVHLYIQGRVTILNCSNQSQLKDGTTQTESPQTTSHFTEKPFNPWVFWEAASRGDLQYIDNEITRLGPSGLNLEWGSPTMKSRTALHEAARKNYPRIVSSLLAAGADPNMKDSDGGKTPMIIAAEEGHDNVLRVLLDPKYQADVNQADRYGNTPVYYAAKEGNTAALEVLLTQGRGDPNQVNKENSSPLFMTAMKGRADCARALIAAGANIDYESYSGNTALHIAAGWGWRDVVQVLLEAGASSKDTKNRTYKETPAEWARREGYHSVAELIENY